jgi:DNA-binding protein H-NS
MQDIELLIKIIDLVEKVDNKINNNNDQLIKNIAEKIEKIDCKLDNFVTKEDCEIKAKENLSIRKITALGIMFGAIGGSLIGIFDKIKKLIETLTKG